MLSWTAPSSTAFGSFFHASNTAAKLGAETAKAALLTAGGSAVARGTTAVVTGAAKGLWNTGCCFLNKGKRAADAAGRSLASAATAVSSLTGGKGATYQYPLVKKLQGPA